jgi:allophanate hydrolase subunit 1
MALGGEYDAVRAVGLMARVVKIRGVEFVDFNYTTNRLTVKFDPDRVSLEKLRGIVTREREHRERPEKGPGSSHGDEG